MFRIHPRPIGSYKRHIQDNVPSRPRPSSYRHAIVSVVRWVRRIFQRGRVENSSVRVHRRIDIDLVSRVQYPLRNLLDTMMYRLLDRLFLFVCLFVCLFLICVYVICFIS